MLPSPSPQPLSSLLLLLLLPLSPLSQLLPLPVTVTSAVISSVAPFSWLLSVGAIITAASVAAPPPPTFALHCKRIAQANASVAWPWCKPSETSQAMQTKPSNASQAKCYCWTNTPPPMPHVCTAANALTSPWPPPQLPLPPNLPPTLPPLPPLPPPSGDGYSKGLAIMLTINW